MRDIEIKDIKLSNSLDGGKVATITASDLVSAIRHAELGKTNKITIKFEAKDKSLKATLEVTDREVLAQILKENTNEAEILKKSRKCVTFWQDFGIAKDGTINAKVGDVTFRLESRLLHSVFNINKNIGDEDRRENWVYESPQPPESAKITGFQDGKVQYIDEKYGPVTEDEIEGWVFLQDKSGGANSPGEHGGVYKRAEKVALIKQEVVRNGSPDNVSNMCEFMGSMLFQHAKPDYGAKVFLARGDKIPDEDGKNIYVGSVFFENYKDLYVDAYESVKRPVPNQRPRLLGSSTSVFSEQIKNENYQGFSDIMPLSLLMGDFDVHWGNVGVVRNPDEKAKMVRIDFAWAFRSDFENDVHPHSINRHIPGLEPTNHFVEYPEEMRISSEFVPGLKEIYDFDFSNAVNEGMDKIGQYYGIEPIREFAKKIGTIGITNTKGKDELIRAVKEELSGKLQRRQMSLKEYATDIDMSLAFNKDPKTGNWGFTGYDGRNIKDIIKENPEMCRKIIDGEQSMHLRRSDQKSPGGFLGILDIFGLYGRYVNNVAVKELSKHKEFIYECCKSQQSDVVLDVKVIDGKTPSIELQNRLSTSEVGSFVSKLEKRGTSPENIKSEVKQESGISHKIESKGISPKDIKSEANQESNVSHKR